MPFLINLVEVICIVVLCFFFLLLQDIDDTLKPSRTDPEDLENDVVAVDIQVTITELGCSYNNGNYYLCDKLPAFEDNSWDHPELEQFAAKVGTLYYHLTEQLPGYIVSIAVEGVADARKIQENKVKNWSNVPDELNPNGLTGKINNHFLADLRAKNTALKISKLLPDGSVTTLDPIDHTATGENKTGANYKAAVVYVTIGSVE